MDSLCMLHSLSFDLHKSFSTHFDRNQIVVDNQANIFSPTQTTRNAVKSQCPSNPLSITMTNKLSKKGWCISNDGSLRPVDSQMSHDKLR
ncbi:hypothetical protein KIN20_031285 [Parelaphostrongylus tenuis]|uniref:Uncharacterized protein n=1 Tax=Parelaphostrongylus tenuis TaxID=148309 RepID=A0AAD5R5D5_PARTN|nr:hypothetical protein KIN20_031285 [Parelaphostrongylus tenuis]